jgi:uncharacterized membrane protein YebE (DUF533 family)
MMFDANKLLNQMLGAGAAAGSKDGPLGEIGGLLGSVLSQSVAGVKEGAADIEKHTGIGGKVDAAIKDSTGKSPADLIEQVKAMAAQNKMATGAVLGGLGALLLGTRGGRGMAGGAAKLGGLALVGGLAYKAYKNYQAGKTPAAASSELASLEATPEASTFDMSGDAAQVQATSILIIRAMIAAAACDGAVDNAERSRIVGGLEKAGLDTAAAKFLDEEFANPAVISDLVAAATTPELAIQVYTAARIAIEPDSMKEKAFLMNLAVGLGLDDAQVAHIDAAAVRAKAE